MQRQRVWGIFSGSALAQVAGLKNARRSTINLRMFGSVNYTEGTVGGSRVVVVPRHGLGHTTSPHIVDYRANVLAMKKLGVTDIIAVTAMGGLTAAYAPGTIAFVDQVADFTFGSRISTFFEDGVVAHIARAQAVCPALHSELIEAAKKLKIRHQPHGKLTVIAGPQFSSKLESEILKFLGLQVVGMTTSPEERLVKELLMNYAVVGQVTDSDNDSSDEPVNQLLVSRRASDMASLASRIIVEVVTSNRERPECDCANSLRGAILTDPNCIDRDTMEYLCYILDVDKVPREFFSQSV